MVVYEYDHSVYIYITGNRVKVSSCPSNRDTDEMQSHCLHGKAQSRMKLSRETYRKSQIQSHLLGLRRA